MGASDRAVRARARAAAGRRCGSSSSPATTPGCATPARPSSSTAPAARRGVDWHFNAWGGLEGGSTPLGPRRPGRREGARDRGRRSLPGAAGARGRLDPRRRRGHGADDRRVPAQPQPQPGALARADRAGAAATTSAPRRSIWLGRGVFDDETDGHVDNLACFARPASSLLTWSEDESDPQHAISRDALARLEAATDARGRALEVITPPLPGPLTIDAPRRPPGSTPRAGTHAAPGRRPPRRLLRQLLPRQLARRHAAARRAPRRRGGGDPRATASPSARWSASRRARSCSAAATSTASPSRSRRTQALAS